MSKSNTLTLLTSDLAGHWTDRVLEAVKAAGVPHISVEVELAAWQVLKKVLRAELHWQQAFRGSTLVSLRVLMDRVLPQAAEQLLMRIRPQAVTSQFRAWVCQVIGAQRSTPAERDLLARIAGHPDVSSALKMPSWSDITPHLRIAGTGV